MSTLQTAGTRRRRWQRLGGKLGASLLAWTLALLFLVPFLWMLSSSLKRNIDVFTLPIRWFPDPVHWANYAEVWFGDKSMITYYVNSLIVTVTGVVGDLTTSAMAGYAFARLKFRGRDRIFLLYLATSIIPAQLLLVPRFMFFQQLGLYDTLWALILPGVFTVYGTFLLRQAFAAAPDALGEAGRIDGANEWQVFWRVYLPLVRPMLAALAIVSFVSTWNDYETPLVMLTSPSNFTIPLGLTTFADSEGGISAGLAMAAAVSALVPVATAFVIFQRQFVEALAHSGIK